MESCAVCKKNNRETIFGKDKKRCLICERKRRKEFYERHIEKERQTALSRYWKNRDTIRQSQKLYYNAIKHEVFMHYGGYTCKCCGEKEKEFLTIDHIDGGGNQHRKAMGGRGTYIYNWIRKNDFPSMFQVLCYNCNLAKARNNNVCPHQFQSAK